MNTIELKRLSAEQKTLLIELETITDPARRFQNNYFQLSRQLLLEDYCTEMEQAASDNDEKEALQAYRYGIERLQKTYLTDLELLFELQLLKHNIFLPWKVSVTPSVQWC